MHSLTVQLKRNVDWPWLIAGVGIATMGLVIATWPETIAIMVGTLVSEDLTSIATGLFIQDGTLGWLPGLVGCYLGIYFGDLGLWLIGRLAGQRVVRWAGVSERRLETLGRWFDERGWIAIVAARFLPGTRMPLYIACGSLGHKGGRFAFWTFLAALLWTPMLVGGVALIGPEVVEPLQRWLGASWLAFLTAAGLFYLAVKLVLLIGHPQSRAKVAARIEKVWRWEFWPTWLFYLPVLPWIGWLMVRYRSVTVWTAANPGIPQGGVVGESKLDILSCLPEDSVIPSALIPPGDWRQRFERVDEIIQEKAWIFPLILKPDVGQRGAGVKLARTMTDVANYLKSQPGAIIVQTYHPGPFEAGVFYVRIPGEKSGRIFSITDKKFPVIVGDGQSTLEQLIWAHSRFRMQAQTFLARHDKEAERVLAAGESFRLAVAGNHCQGTLFLDGSQLITPELERRFDEIARHFEGFFFGRFDVRYSDVDAFKAGKELGIVELNGVTSESTNIYDPSRSLLSAYQTLFQQWSLLFHIGDANRRLGQQPTPLWTLVTLIWSHLRSNRTTALAD